MSMFPMAKRVRVSRRAFLTYGGFGFGSMLALAGRVRAGRTDPFSAPIPVGAPFEATLVDVGAAAGLSAVCVSGNPDTKRWIIETTGCGIAFFDYDQDGWLDIFQVNGSTLEAGNWKLKTRNPEIETGRSKIENRKSKIKNRDSGAAGSASGIFRKKVEPCPGSDSTQMRPATRRTSSRQM